MIKILKNQKYSSVNNLISAISYHDTRIDPLNNYQQKNQWYIRCYCKNCYNVFKIQNDFLPLEAEGGAKRIYCNNCGAVDVIWFTEGETQ